MVPATSHGNVIVLMAGVEFSAIEVRFSSNQNKAVVLLTNHKPSRLDFPALFKSVIFSRA